MTRYTLLLFQEAYPEQIKIDRIYKEDGSINIYCYLLNENKDIHMTLFDAGGFKNDEEIDNLINKLLSLEV